MGSPETREGFHKWFQEIESILFTNCESISSDSDEDEDEEELPLGKRQRIERVKKFIASTANSDVFLELEMDSRSHTTFVSDYSPLEGFTVLGALAYFSAYVQQPYESNLYLSFLKRFTDQYRSKYKSLNKEYLQAMEDMERDLVCYCRDPNNNENDSNSTRICEAGSNPATLGIKLFFLAQFEGELFLDRMSVLLDEILQFEDSDGEWNLFRYNFLRRIRRQKEQVGLSELELSREKLALEIACQRQQQPLNPRHVLAKCQFLSDFLASNGEPDLEFGGQKFATHSEIVTFIRKCSETITLDYPTFLRANFVFADIFANELRITSQDRQFAWTLLNKALDANPDSSKIHCKKGLLLVKGRQFSDAINCFQKAIALTPSSTDAYHALATLLLRDHVMYRESLESFFGPEFDEAIENLGTENELSFWKGCYLFKLGEKEQAIKMWVGTILEFYVSKPELDLEAVLPFNKLDAIAKYFFWTKSGLTLDAVIATTKEIGKEEQSRRRVVYHRLHDLVFEALCPEVK